MSDVFLDTNVISELFRKRPAQQVVDFIETCATAWVSVIVFHELTFGAERLPDGADKQALLAFVEAMRTRFHARTADVTLPVAELGARLRATASRQGRILAEMDSLIAAAAMARSGTLATRNTKDFEGLNVSLINPWNQN